MLVDPCARFDVLNSVRCSLERGEESGWSHIPSCENEVNQGINGHDAHIKATVHPVLAIVGEIRGRLFVGRRLPARDKKNTFGACFRGGVDSM